MQPQPNYDHPNDQQPAPPPQGSSVYLYSAAPTPAAKPQRSSTFAVVIIGIILVPILLDKVAGLLADHRPSGVVYQGRPISQSEAKATVKDFANISKSLQATPLDGRPAAKGGAKPMNSGEAKAAVRDLAGVAKTVTVGNSGSSDVAAPAQTELGRRFQKLIQTAQAQNLQYQKDAAEARSDEFLTPAQLGNDDGRAFARKTLADYRAATATYRRDSAELAEQLAAFSKELSGQVPPNFAQHNAEQAEMAHLDDDQTAAIERVLDFVDRAKPSYDSSSNKLIFTNDQDVAEYGQLARDLGIKQQKLEQRRAEIMQNRQKSIQEANQRLQQDANQP